MANIFTEYTLRGHLLKNRIVFPPFVNFGWTEDNGYVTSNHIDHYRDIAKGGAGIVIVEATCVQKSGRITTYQLGAWSDEQIEGLSKICAAAHNYNTKILLQIHHSGLVTRKAISEFAYGPSVQEDNDRSRELTVDQIKSLTEDFIKAAIRAERAGFDGVELHGAHGYLLSQFATPVLNLRNDAYGGSDENRLRFAEEIVKGIRESTNDSFIVGYRMSANSPTLDHGISVAKQLEKIGVDYIHASHGGEKGIIPEVPTGFDYNGIVYSGTEVKKHVQIPVIVVNEIKTPDRANWLIENNLADFVAIGRDMVTDKQWVNKAKNNEKIDYCIQCQPRCKRYTKAESCPLFN